MIDHGKKNVLGVLVDAVDYEAAVKRVITAARARRRFTCTALAVHGVMTGVLDATQRYRLNHLDLVVPDGQPVRWALALLYGMRLPDRVYGPELTLRLCEAARRRDLPLYLYGGKREVVDRMRASLLHRFPGLRIAGTEPSRFRRLTGVESDATVERISSSGAAMTLVGLGCPRQEVWAFEFGQALSMPVVCVGAAFDFLSGVLPQASPALQRAGLEWLYRWWQEPIRLWRRYLLLNPLYLLLLVAQRLRLGTFDAEAGERPRKETRYG